MAHRFAIGNALISKRTVVDALVDAMLLQVLVGKLRPEFAPCLDETRTGFAIVEFARFAAKAVGIEDSGSQEDVRVNVARVAFAARGMDAHVGGAAVYLHDFARKGKRKVPLRSEVKLVGERNLEFARNCRVFACLCFFGRVPELRTIKCPFRRIVGKHDLGV